MSLFSQLDLFPSGLQLKLDNQNNTLKEKPRNSLRNAYEDMIKGKQEWKKERERKEGRKKGKKKKQLCPGTRNRCAWNTEIGIFPLLHPYYCIDYETRSHTL